MTSARLASLIETARQFHPRGISPADERYTETPEYLRAREAWRSASRNEEPWQRVLALLRKRATPIYLMRDLTVPYMHPSWRVALLRGGHGCPSMG
jgi:hypothetical protein